jgi:cobalt-zinc-cadmium efflux system membrane fusion protein
MIWVEKAPRQFTRRDLKLGLEQNGLVQVLSGVQPGERVVAEGGVFLSNVEHVYR